jgi:hypothetical protein
LDLLKALLRISYHFAGFTPKRNFNLAGGIYARNQIIKNISGGLDKLGAYARRLKLFLGRNSGSNHSSGEMKEALSTYNMRTNKEGDHGTKNF